MSRDLQSFQTVKACSAPGELGSITFAALVDLIKVGTPQIQHLRSIADEAEQKKYKVHNLMAWSPSVTFDGYRDEKHISSFTGLVKFDFDGKENAGLDPAKLRDRLSEHPSVMLAAISVRGGGVNGALLVDRLPVDAADYKRIEQQVRAMLEKWTGAKADNMSESAKCLVISHDPDVYVNAVAEPWVVPAAVAKAQETPEDILKEAARKLMDAGPGHREVRFEVARMVAPLRLGAKDPKLAGLVAVARMNSNDPDNAEEDLLGAIKKLQDTQEDGPLDVQVAPWLPPHVVAAAAADVLRDNFRPVTVNDALRATVPELSAPADSAKAPAFLALYQKIGFYKRNDKGKKAYCGGPAISSAVFDDLKRMAPPVRIGRAALIGGQFVDAPGLHAAHGYYCTEQTRVLDYQGPGKHAVVELYDSIFRLFPFVDSDHLVRLFAAIMTPFLSIHLRGAIPAILVSAPNRGDGKTLLARCIARLADEKVIVIPHGNGPKFEENLLAALDSDSRVIIIDNVKSEVGGATLETLITSGEIRGNLKYEGSRTFTSDKLIFITGVNPILSPDMTRRVMRIRVDRRGAPQPQDLPDLDELIPADRGRFLGMIKTILTTWDGSVLPVSGHKGFEAWAGTIGGILASCGVPVDGLRLIDPETLAAEHDADAIHWGEVLDAWYGRWGELPIGATEIVGAAGSGAIRNAIGARGDEVRLLGAALSGMDGRVICGYRVRKHKEKVYSAWGENLRSVYGLERLEKGINCTQQVVLTPQVQEGGPFDEKPLLRVLLNTTRDNQTTEEVQP